MTPFLLAALMAATAMNDTVVRGDIAGTVTFDRDTKTWFDSVMADTTTTRHHDGCNTTTCRGWRCTSTLVYCPPTGTGEPVRLEPDTIGYWLDWNGATEVKDGKWVDHYDTVYVLRRRR